MSIHYLALSIPGYGQINSPDSVPTLDKTGPSSIISWGLGLFITAGIIAALVFVIYGGFKWMTSSGDKAKLDSARKTIMFAVVGLIMMVLALMGVKLLSDLTGISYF